jgi:SOS-response transcriptional repressor LexA
VTGRPPRDDRRDAILDFIADWWLDHDHGPTYREIAEGLGFATASCAGYHVRILAEAGVVAYDPKTPRTLRAVEL